MRPNRIRLIDLGIDPAFTRGFEQLMASIESINIDHVQYVDDDGEDQAASKTAIAEIEAVRSRNFDILDHALTAEALVVHINAHGDSSDPYSGLVLSSGDGDTEYEISMEGLEWPIVCDGLILDACRTNTDKVRRQLRHTLIDDLAFIGTTRNVGWHDGVVWSSAFYGALLRRKGAGLDPVKRIVDAADRANRAFKEVTDRKSPYRCDVLEPSARALKTFEE